MQEHKKISVVIPCFNEAPNIPKIIKEIELVFETLNYNYEIILIDDGSIDNTITTFNKESKKKFQR